MKSVFMPPPLDHETIDHPVEEGAVVVPVTDVLLEVGAGDGGLVGVQLDQDVAVVGGELDHGVSSRSRFRSSSLGQVEDPEQTPGKRREIRDSRAWYGDRTSHGSRGM